ncbi:MAG: ABC transporter ATP-binding protein, partial [Planctomycetales bacterium]
RLHGYSVRQAKDNTERVLDVVGMTDRQDRKLAGCSRGMRQRLNLAQALVHNPEILLLDEPMAGIDPGGRRELAVILKRLAKEGTTIVISSHILDEVERLTDHVIMLAHGRLVASGTLSEIRDMIDNQPLTVELLTERSRELAARLAASPEVRSLEINGSRLTVRTTSAAKFFEGVNAIVLEDEFELEGMEVLDAGAEAVFQYLDRAST